MSKKPYDETSVIKSFKRFKSISIDSINRTIFIVKNNTELGNGSFGKIDYLIKYRGFKINYVDYLAKKPKVVNNEDNYKVTSKRDKVNLVNMTKDIMKRYKKM